MGVVHHANYLHYMEDGRTRFLEELGLSYAELERTGCGLPVRRAQLRFLRGAGYDEELVVTTTVAGMRAASVTFGYVIRGADGERVATGEIELACVDLASERKPRPLPGELVELLRPWVAAGEA